MIFDLPEMRDADGLPLRDGFYLRLRDAEKYSISSIEQYKFHASTKKYDHVVPNCTDVFGYAEFARQFVRIPTAAELRAQRSAA